MFGFGKKRKVKAAMEKMAMALTDDDFQIRILGPEQYSRFKSLSAIDRHPKAIGEFGGSPANAIPTNGPIGSIAYLSQLIDDQGNQLLFHRLKTVEDIDIYEYVSLSGSLWGFFCLDMYNSRKSRQAPNGFSISRTPRQFTGFNHYWDDFPLGFSDQKESMPKDLRLLYAPINEISEAMRGKAFVPDERHLEIRQGLLQVGQKIPSSVQSQDSAALGAKSGSTTGLTGKVVDQMIGFQSVLYRQLKGDLGIPDEDLDRLEITFFAMSIVALCVLYFSQNNEKEAVAEKAQLETLKRSLPESGHRLDLQSAIGMYQERFAAYKKSFDLFFDKDATEPEVVLGEVAFGYIVGRSTSRPPFMALKTVFLAGVVDNMEFAKTFL